MSPRSLLLAAFVVATVGVLTAGCSTSHSTEPAQTTVPSSTTTQSAARRSHASTGSAPPGALTAEAQQAAAGDIPDNQVFLILTNTDRGYSIKYPEGWAQRGSANSVTFRDKNNLVRVSVRPGGSVTLAAAQAEMRLLEQQTPSLRLRRASDVTVGSRHAVKVVYSTRSAPNPVTGKSVTLVVDRYYVPGGGKHAVVDLGTPEGVDNVDAYRLMIESFRWR
jgi:hypothetical protein